ncbi:MAG TPA: radical SAM protein [Patescibacteria group bacterium]|nr:radical SAM protein [Patescibacteria group bacterium]
MTEHAHTEEIVAAANTPAAKNAGKFKFVHIVTTINCPSRCKMCFNWQNNAQDEIEGERIKQALDELHKNDMFTEDAVVIFGGAEALLRKDIFDLVRFAEERNLCTVVGTSGYLYNDHIASQITSSGLRCLALSFDSLDPKKHNYLRGVDGIFENIRRIIHEHPRKTSLTCTISSYNVDEICDIAEWVESNDDLTQLGYQAIVMPFNLREPRKDWFANPALSHLWPKDSAAVDANLTKLIEFRKGSKKIYTSPRHLQFFREYFRDPQHINRNATCRVGDYSLTIMNKGDVVFCNSLPPLGNIRENSIMDILTSPQVRQRKQQMLDCKIVCEFYVNCFFED